MAIIEKKFSIGGKDVVLQTGLLARQADSAVLIRCGAMVLLVSVVVNNTGSSNDFLPLSVHFQSKAYAYGRIPGGFKRREGPPSESEILISRLIDRPIRPLFPKWFTKEVQVVATLLSSDPLVEPDVMAIIATSAALRLAGLPLGQSIGGVRVGLNDQSVLLLNPAVTESPVLDLVIAGNRKSLFMVEAAAKQVSEEQLVRALDFGQKALGEIEEAINNFVDLASTEGFLRTEGSHEAPIMQEWMKICDRWVQNHTQSYWADLLDHSAKKDIRQDWMQATKKQWIEACKIAISDDTIDCSVYLGMQIEFMIRAQTLVTGHRLDGRSFDQIRPIEIRTSILPSSHGSALFTRGWTQSLTSAILGTAKDGQFSDSHDPRESKDLFLLHYNFPPYSVGELGPIGSPKRREIGHGRLARKALESVLPLQAQFPYVIRLVSEILESDGSSSMATVCAGTLALMDAGVPISSPVAGIAMGLIQEGDRIVILSDICGEEDAVGDMDFKVAGTLNGVTALQMDIKTPGITAKIMESALEQARAGRIRILSAMTESLPQVRAVLADHAPRVNIVKIRPDQVRDLIGKGGSTIKMLTELSGAILDVLDDGTVTVVSYNMESSEKAKILIAQVTDPLTIGQFYDATVTKILEFGFVASTVVGKDGLVHFSECPFRLEEMGAHIDLGQKVRVKLIQIDKVNNKYKFSLLS